MTQRNDPAPQRRTTRDPLLDEVMAGAAPPPHRPADDEEKVYFDGSPLLRSELTVVLGWGLVGLVLIVVGTFAFAFSWAWWPGWWLSALCYVLGALALALPYLLTKLTRYRITNYRIDYERGLFNKRIDTLELWHVDDISFSQSLVERVLGVGTIHIVSGDATTPNLPLHGIPNPRPVFDALKQRVIAVKRQRGVIKMDL